MNEILSLKTDLARDDVNIPTHTLETAILLPKNESTAVENPKLPHIYPPISSMLFVNPFEKKKKKKKKGKKKR